MSKNINKIIVSLVIVFLICLASCYMIVFIPAEIPPSPTVFDQTGCEKPCWNSLQVGVSTKDDVEKTLAIYPKDPSKVTIDKGLYQSGIEFIEITLYEETYRYYSNGPAPVITFVFEQNGDNIVDRIYISNMILMEQALEIFGEPETALVTSYEFLPDFWKKDMYLYYPKQGLSIACFEGTTFVNNKDLPCYDFTLVSLEYLNPDDYLVGLEERFGNIDLVLQYMKPYQGLDVEYPVLEQQ